MSSQTTQVQPPENQTPQTQALNAGAGEARRPKRLRKIKAPIMLRIDPDLLSRIDQAATRLGISRSAFIVSGAARQVEAME